jgi:hypothetical protein
MELKLQKMQTALDKVVKYTLLNDENTIDVNALIGQKISLEFKTEP